MPRKKKSGDEFYRSLGGAIRERRDSLGLSLDALGKKAGGLTRATVSGIEKGRQQVGVYQLHLFASALGVNTDDLIREALSHEDISKRLGEITIRTKNKNGSIRLADL